MSQIRTYQSPKMESTEEYPNLANVHPLKLFDIARSQGRFLFASAPMVRYSKLAFRQTVHHYGTDLCWTPMILAKEFNRNEMARNSDFTLSTASPQPPTVAQFGANSPLELSRAASLIAPYVSGVDLNCGCPQSWACAETLGAALMGKRELVRDMVVATRERLRSDGWNVGIDDAREDGRKGKSISVKIRVHGDLRHTVDFLETLVPSREGRLIDFLTIHPRTRATPSTQPINLEALGLLTDMFGDRVPILVSGDVFALSQLPYRSPSLRASLRPPSPAERDGRGENGGDDDRDSVQQQEQSRASSHPPPPPADDGSIVEIPKLAGLMSARALLANPALFAGHDTCPWEAVERFMANVARAPLPLRLTLHHLSEMCGPGYGRDKTPLLSRKERQALLELTNMCDVIDFLDEKVAVATGRPDGMRRSFDGGG